MQNMCETIVGQFAEQEIPTPVPMDHQWLPFTPNRDFLADPKMFLRAKGVHYIDSQGKEVIDGVSGLFTSPAGHGRIEIANAVRDQLLELDFTPSFLRAHSKSFALSNEIASLLPPSLNKLFFVSSGSESVDTAMKICLAYHRARGDSGRSIFVSRERAYHGVNFGGVSLAGMVNNRRAFGGSTLPVVHMRHTWTEQNRFVPGQAQKGAELADDLQRFIQLHGAENIAACIVEPIAGSTGVLVPPIGYLERLREISTANGILLVFDEVICGFGRTGKPFAAQSFGVVPDIITMAKSITNGCIPMGAVAVSDAIYETIIDAAPGNNIEFFHGYTWSAHPVACAAGLVSLKIYRDERLYVRAESLSVGFLKTIFELVGTPGIIDIRGYGMLAGVDVDPKVIGMDGYTLQKRLFERGLHIKATGDCVIFAPPFVSTQDQICEMVDIFRDTVHSLSSGRSV
jgi:beta-alanine--pyruvate transaminase